MNKSTVRLLQALSDDSLRLLDGLEADGELRSGFVEELVRELATERFHLAKAMLAACPEPTASSTARDLRTAISRLYYSCHHACRAALLSKLRHDFRGHRDVVRQVAIWARKDTAWSPTATTIEQLLDRRHLADYDPYDTGGTSTPFTPVSFEADILAYHSRASGVVAQVETFLRNAKVIS